MIETVASMLLDPFRAGLIFFLVLTARRTRATMGLSVPLAAGVVFIAALLPLTTGSGLADAAGGMIPAILAGIVANTILLGLVLLGWTVWDRARR